MSEDTLRKACGLAHIDSQGIKAITAHVLDELRAQPIERSRCTCLPLSVCGADPTPEEADCPVHGNNAQPVEWREGVRFVIPTAEPPTESPNAEAGAKGVCGRCCGGRHLCAGCHSPEGGPHVPMCTSAMRIPCPECSALKPTPETPAAREAPEEVPERCPIVRHVLSWCPGVFGGIHIDTRTSGEWNARTLIPFEAVRADIADGWKRERDEAQSRLADVRSQAERVAKDIETRIATALDTVSSPGGTPVGAPGSVMRRAWEMGRKNAEVVHDLKMRLGAATSLVASQQEDIEAWTRTVAELHGEREAALREARDMRRVRDEELCYVSMSHDERNALRIEELERQLATATAEIARLSAMLPEADENGMVHLAITSTGKVGSVHSRPVVPIAVGGLRAVRLEPEPTKEPR